MSRSRLEELQKVAAEVVPPKLPMQPAAQEEAAPAIEENSKKSNKKSKKKKKKEKEKRLEEENVPQQPKDPLKMEEFFKQMELVEQGLAKIEQNCKGTELAHQMILDSVSEDDIKEQEGIIGAFTNSTNKVSLSTKGTLETMEAETKRLGPVAPPGSGDFRMRRVNTAALLQKFSNAMTKFQSIQKDAASHHQIQVERQYKIMNPSADDEEIAKVTEAVGSMTLTSQQIFALGQTNSPLETLEKMKGRRKEVMDIEKGIYTLNQLFINMQTMVEEQGQIIDNLEDYMQETVQYTEEAEGHMIEAVETQKNIRRLKCNIL